MRGIWLKRIRRSEVSFAFELKRCWSGHMTESNKVHEVSYSIHAETNKAS